eukprot:390417_1
MEGKKSLLINVTENDEIKITENDACDGESHLLHYSRKVKYCHQRRICFYYSMYIFSAIFLWIIYANQEFMLPVILAVTPGLLVIMFGTMWLHRIANRYSVELDLKLVQLLTIMIIAFFVFGFCAAKLAMNLNGEILLELSEHLNAQMAEDLASSIGAPFIEEACKFLMVFISFLICKYFVCHCKDYKLDIKHVYYLQIVAICIGSSFGTFENLIYVLGSSTTERGETAFARQLICVPFHSATPFVMMTVILLIHFREITNYRMRWIIVGFMHPVIVHMINNAGIVLLRELEIDGVSGLIFFIWVVSLDLISVRYWERKLISRMHSRKVGYSHLLYSACLCC